MFLIFLSIIPRIFMITIFSILLIFTILKYPHIEEDIKKKIKRNIDTEDFEVKQETVNISRFLYIMYIILSVCMLAVFIFTPWQ